MLKFYYHKYFLHNRKQPWIILLLSTVAYILVCALTPLETIVADYMENHLLLSCFICLGLLIAAILVRTYFFTKVRDGATKARGCASTGCLLSVVLLLCLGILSIKCCRQHINTKPHIVKEIKMAKSYMP